MSTNSSLSFIPGLSSARCLIFELEEKQSLRRRMSDLNRLLAFLPFCDVRFVLSTSSFSSLFSCGVFHVGIGHLVADL